ncbi:MAG: hypothetical protein ABIF82_12585 [Planctomycetota bacterium]
MNDELVACLKRIKENPQAFENEEATKQWAILPVLACLGWDCKAFGEVIPEYNVREGRVDYCLKHKGREQCFVEAKNAGQDLRKSEEQLLKYVFESRADIAVLTNGMKWWFYLPHEKGSWEEKRFLLVSLEEREALQAAEFLEQILAKEALVSGAALEAAKKLVRRQEIEKLIKGTLPKAWNQLISQPDGELVALVIETVEKLCGSRPDTTAVAEFIKGQRPRAPGDGGGGGGGKRPSDEERRGGGGRPDGGDGDWISADRIRGGMKPLRFSFAGESQNVSSWKEAWVKVVEVLVQIHPGDPDRLCQLKGYKAEYVSKDRARVDTPVPLGDTGFFVETHLGAVHIGKLCCKALRLLGHDPNELKIQVRK